MRSKAPAEPLGLNKCQSLRGCLNIPRTRFYLAIMTNCSTASKPVSEWRGVELEAAMAESTARSPQCG